MKSGTRGADVRVRSSRLQPASASTDQAPANDTPKCKQCHTRPARVVMVDRGWARACKRCADAIYGIDDV